MGEERQLLKLIRKGVAEAELEDTVSQAVKSLKSMPGKSFHSSEWSEADGLVYYCGKIYVPPANDIRRKIVSLNHDTKLAGHPERWKTLKLVSRNYWWPQMS